MGKKLEWPIGEDMIGKKVVFKGYTNPYHTHWNFTKGCVYVIGRAGESIGPLNAYGSTMCRNWGFHFELIETEKEDMNLKDRIEQLEKELAELKKSVDVEPVAEEWQPRGGHWYVCVDGSVRAAGSSHSCKLFGLEYPTKELAEKALKAMRQHNRLLAYVMEHAPDYEPDWGDENKKKWYVEKRYVENPARRGKWETEYTYSFQKSGLVYMPEHVAKQLVKDLTSGRVTL